MSDILDFEPKKIHSLIVFILDYMSKDIGKIELAKLIYHVDIEAYRLTGKTITEDEYTRQIKDPVVDSLYCALSDMANKEVIVEKKPSVGFSIYPKHSHRIGKQRRFDLNLSEIEIAVIIRTLNMLRDKKPRELEKLAYKTEPMKRIVHLEGQLGYKAIGAKLDMSTTDRNLAFQRWKKNLGSRKPDKEYEEYLAGEKQEVEEFFAV